MLVVRSALVVALFGAGAPCLAEDAPPIDTSVCQIFCNPQALDNKLVRVRAILRAEMEYSLLVDPACPYLQLGLKGDENLDPLYEAAWKLECKGQRMGVWATITATFREKDDWYWLYVNEAKNFEPACVWVNGLPPPPPRKGERKTPIPTREEMCAPFKLK